MDTLYERLKEKGVGERIAKTASEIGMILKDSPDGCILIDIIKDLEFKNAKVFKNEGKYAPLFVLNTIKVLEINGLVEMQTNGSYRLTTKGRDCYEF